MKPLEPNAEYALHIALEELTTQEGDCPITTAIMLVVAMLGDAGYEIVAKNKPEDG